MNKRVHEGQKKIGKGKKMHPKTRKESSGEKLHHDPVDTLSNIEPLWRGEKGIFGKRK